MKPILACIFLLGCGLAYLLHLVRDDQGVESSNGSQATVASRNSALSPSPPGLRINAPLPNGPPIEPDGNRLPMQLADAKALLNLPAQETVEMEHQALSRILRRSGHTNEAWVSTAQAILGRLSEMEECGTRTRLDDIACFSAGCLANLTFSAAEAEDACTESIFQTVSEWSGNHILTALRQTQTGRTASVILVRPM